MVCLEFFKGKRVFITGHTGFKGSWICAWLSLLGARVSGYSVGIPTRTAMFEKINVGTFIENDIRGDITDIQSLSSAIKMFEPEIVIHLAAQPIVFESYYKPLETLNTNIIGTACVLEAIRQADSVRSALIVTTDKCYENKGWIWGYREIDTLGGVDPYSCSKACAELVTASYIKSFFQQGNCHIATARAGNVIGGGDWAENRLIPDIIRSIEHKGQVVIRHPEYVRPWQHVMEPLYGYLLLCQKLYEVGDKFSGPWNFGPNPKDSVNVGYVANKICSALGGSISYDCEKNKPYESEALRLECSKANIQLGWKPMLNTDECLELTIEWYKKNFESQNMYCVTNSQLENYMKLIK